MPCRDFLTDVFYFYELKIVHCLNHYLPAQVAGTEVYTAALARELTKLGAVCTIVIPNYNMQQNETYIFEGIRVIKYAEPSVPDRALIAGLRPPDGLKNFIAVLKSERPDVVHFHELAGSNGITLRHVTEAKKLGIKLVFTFHLAGYTCKTGTLVYKENEICNGKILLNKCSTCYLQSKGYGGIKNFLVPLSHALFSSGINTQGWNNKIGTGLATVSLIAQQKKNVQALVSTCDKLIVLTDWYRKILELNAVNSEKMVHIPQALPLPSVALKEAGGYQKNNVLKIIFVGRIHPLKGVHLLVEAVLKLNSEKVSLDIYGQSAEGEYEARLKQRTAGAGNIHWKGKLAQADVVPTMQQYGLLCLCSTFSEMSPLVIQEAFAAGIPVLASGVYGNAEQIIPNKNGWLFQFKNADDLQHKIQNLIDDASLMENAKLNIKPVRNFNEVAYEQMEVYKKISAGI